MKYIIGMALGMLLLVIPSLSSFSSEGLQWDPKLIASDNVVITENDIKMNIPADNKLPFGAVWGNVINPAQGYPVIIEIYKDNKPVMFAQTDVKSDDTYRYQFRVYAVSGGQEIHVFSGDYNVKIFKAVNNVSTTTA